MNSITNEQVKLIFNMVLSKVVSTLPEEESPDSLCSFAICIERCIKTNEELTKTLSNDMLSKIHASLLNCLRDSAERMDARNVMMTDQDNDEEDIERLKEQNEQEALLSTNISDAIGALVEVYRDDFIPVLQTEYETLNTLLSPDALDIQKRAALYIFCDVVQHCSTKVLEQSQLEFANHFKNAACNTSDVCVRQAGIFSLGLLFEKSEGTVSSTLPPTDVLNLCFAQFTAPCYQEADDVEDVQDNAAMTIGRICKYCPSLVNCNEVYPQWLSCFPIRNDDDCSQWCYTEMIRLIEANNVAFTGKDGVNIPKIIHWIAEVAYTDMSNEMLDQSLSNLIRQVQSNERLMSSLKTELPPYLMEKLQQHA